MNPFMAKNLKRNPFYVYVYATMIEFENQSNKNFCGQD